MIKNAKEIISNSPLSKTLENYSYTLRKEGSSYTCKCPNCGEDNKGKGLKLFKDDKKGKCYQCDTTITPSIVVSIEEKLDIKSAYQKILEILAQIHNLHTEYEQPKTNTQKKEKNGQKNTNPAKAKPLLTVSDATEFQGPTGKLSFRDQQLQASGITDSAQKAWYIDDSKPEKTRIEINLFRSGTKNDAGEIVNGDDMVIRKIDLDRRIRTFFKPKRQKGEFFSTPLPEWRIRYKIPSHHLDKYGKEMKYASPFGSTGSPFHPEPLLNAFEKGIQFDTYHIDEGEKKSTKRNMHGMLGSGAMGINNMAYNSALHPDFDRIIKHNGVKNVVFTLDADCFDLPSDLTKPIDSRARSFLGAVRNYRQYFYAMTTQGIDLNIFIAWINKNEAGEKGVDDLLAGTLAGKEDLLKRDYETAMAFQPTGKGTYVTVIDITGYSEQKLKDLFYLGNREQFIKHHQAELLARRNEAQKEIKEPVEFAFGAANTKWSLAEDGEISLAQPLSEEEIFWSISSGKRGINVEMHYHKLDAFMRNRLIGRVLTSNPNDKAEYRLVRAFPEQKIVKEVSGQEIRDYINEFLLETGEEYLYNYLRKNKALINDETILAGPIIEQYIHYLRHDLNKQYLFFQNGFWQIDSRGITAFNLQDSPGFITPSELVKHSPTFIQDTLVKFTKEGDLWKSEFTDRGKECHVLQFLWNASNFQWQETQKLDAAIQAATDPQEKQKLQEQLQAFNTEITAHLINKMTGIGYLCHSVFNPAVAKVVIPMDGKNSSVHDSFGRSGKSLLVDMLSEVLRLVKIDGKKPNVTDDPFAFQEVTLDTRVIAYDDVRPNFDFTRIFSGVTGNTKLRGVYKSETTIPKEKTPKYLVTTNYFVLGDSDSYKDRQFFILFSDYYSASHKPIDDFKNMFFVQWDPDNPQWDLFFRFIAECIRLYLEHGLIEVNDGQVKNRQMRGKIGESFLTFMNEYVFHRIPEEQIPSVSSPYGIRIKRKPMQDKFFDEYPNEKKFTNALRFREKLGLWAEYMGLEINKHKPKINRKTLAVESPSGGRDATGGDEYFTFTLKDENLIIPLDAPNETPVDDQQDNHLYNYQASNNSEPDALDF